MVLLTMLTYNLFEIFMTSKVKARVMIKINVSAGLQKAF